MSAPVVVIGADPDALVAAHTLARAGRAVLVLDAHGADPDATSGWVPPSIVRELGLEQRGLQFVRTDPWAAAPLPDGGRLELWHEVARSVEAIRHVSPRDAAQWPAFCAHLARLARVVEPLYAAPPPDPLASGSGGGAR